MPPRRRTYGSDQTGRCAGDGARPSEAHDERDGGRGPAPRQCLEQDRLSIENVKPLRASVPEVGQGGERRTKDPRLTTQRFQGRKSRRYAGTTPDGALASSTR